MRAPTYWHRRTLASWLLAPYTLVYAVGAWIDRALSTPRHAPVPIISIGNVTAGGAGKTPTTLALIPLLQALGHTPHILTRGYKGSALTAHRVTENDTASIVGDEALLLARAAPTWVGRDRYASAQAAANAGATILVCDDALQHHALHKDLSLLVVDGPYGIGNGFLIPAGPLRETLDSALARVDAVVMIGEDAQHLSARIAKPIFRAKLAATGDTAFLAQQKWLAFAGIGRPEKFFDTLRTLGTNLATTRAFPDHHVYSHEDAQHLLDEANRLGATLITTAKDAVKWPFAEHKPHVLDVALVLENPQDFSAFLREKLRSLTPS